MLGSSYNCERIRRKKKKKKKSLKHGVLIQEIPEPSSVGGSVMMHNLQDAFVHKPK